ncbi:MAG: type IV pilin, partial [Thermoplasmata archaeon]|nr:type IV pilin [Thermoplasmata archaeon]
MIQTSNIKGSCSGRVTKYKLLHFISINRQLRKDIIAVSEAIGTILLLAIAMTVVATIGIWVATLDQPEEEMNVKLTSKLENEIITIEHQGGETLDEKDTRVIVKIEGAKDHYYKLAESENDDLDDNKWTIGDVWVRDISAELVGFTKPQIEVVVKDLATGNILLAQIVQEGSRLNLPDLAVTSQDITFDFEGDDLVIRNWLNVSATIWNIGNSPAQNVIVRFFDENELLTRDGEDYQIMTISNKSGNNSHRAWVNFTTKYWGKRVITVKIYSNMLETNYQNNFAIKSLFVEPVAPVVHGPDLEFSSYDIIFSNSNPIHGDSVKITVLTHNTGDEDIPKGKKIRIHLFDDKGALDRNYTFSSGLTAGTYHPCDFGVWDARPGGISVITVEADITEQVNETKEDNNNASRPIQIMPTIIVVDDDGFSSGKFDVFEEMASNLEASGVNYRWVKTDDGANIPSYDSGQYHLKDFDIIIWMTGYETANTLTADNIESLNRSLNNGSYLWVIGQDILSDITNNIGDGDGLPEPGEFVYDYLGVDQYLVNGTPEIIEGIYDDPITNGSLINTSSIVEAEDRGVKLQPKLPSPSEPRDEAAGILKNDTLLGNGWYNSLRYYNASKGFKVVYFGWECAGINDIIDRVNLTYHVLKWFNWSISIGKDFAVSSEEFSTETPKFMDQLTISATIRNNGPLPGDNVRVMFYISGPDDEEEPIPKHPDNKDNPQTLFVPGDGGEITVNKQWLAVTVGQHNFRVMVDPYDEYDEVSEENNDVEYSDLFVTELFIRYNILVVDDDNSTNNALAGTCVNVTGNITNTLEFLGYSYDLHVVQGGFAPDRGPDVSTMKYYNTVIWLTGNETDNTLWIEDQDNLTAYLEGNYYEAQYLGETKVNLWLIGQDILDDLEGPGFDTAPQTPFVQDILGVSTYTTDMGLPSTLKGVSYDPITHGITYPMNTNVFFEKGDTIVPNQALSATGILWQNAAQTQYNALKRNASRYNVIFYPWESSFIDNPLGLGGGGMFAYNVWDIPGLETNQAELVYLTLHWLGFPEIRIELKTSEIDIELSNFNPMLGSAYVINTNIYNYGVNETSVVVRFFDGDTIIDTKSVYIGMDDNSSIEVIWTPLFAGPRTITVA